MREHFVVLVTTSASLYDSTLDLATRLASRANAVLLFLHIVPLRPSDGEAALHGAAEFERDETEAWLLGLRPSDSGVRFRHRLAAGDPERVVSGFVADHDVDLVVVEEPPRSKVSRALWRGLAERLIRSIDRPVVIGGPGFLRSKPAPPQPVRMALGPTTVADLLNAMVEARVEALRTWMDHQAEAVRRIAASDTVRAVIAGRTSGFMAARIERDLAVELEEHRRALRAIDWRLTAGDRVWGGRGFSPVAGRALADFQSRVYEEGYSTSLPLFLDEGVERLVILTAAKVVGGDGGLLLFSIDAEHDFLRILGQPGPLPSFETYAFDVDGVMLSNSRFPDYLHDAGLLPDEGQQTPLRLRVAEPSDGPIERWPLTRMARDAVQARDGYDTRGYMDYRGMPVVGAWRWLADYRFGVAAEVDRGVVDLDS